MNGWITGQTNLRLAMEFWAHSGFEKELSHSFAFYGIVWTESI